MHNYVFLLLHTFSYICRESEILLFMETAMTTQQMMAPVEYENFKEMSLSPHIEMILLEDSDLYAVISQLKLLEESHISKILVYEVIAKEFSSLLERYIGHKSFSIHTFQSKQDLLIPCIPNKINILSIWSEDIRAAKALAKSSRQRFVFINTYMDFNCNFVMPMEKQRLKFPILLRSSETVNESPTEPDSIMKQKKDYPIYNLFYNGTWHKPENNEYWVYKDCKCADATREDFERCVASAQKGYENWSALSIQKRMRIIIKLAQVLECHGKFELNRMILTWVAYIFSNVSSSRISQGLELSMTRNPLGIIYIREENETLLFEILIQSLLMGNSVIVIITNSNNSYNLLPYCDMFSTSNIPPGVINVMSSIHVMAIAQLITKTSLKTICSSITETKLTVLPIQ